MRDTTLQALSNDLEVSDAEGAVKPTNQITIVISMFTNVLNNFDASKYWKVAVYALIYRIKNQIIIYLFNYLFCNNKIELKYLSHIKLAL